MAPKPGKNGDAVQPCKAGQQKASKQTPMPFPLLELPAELRNHVYSFIARERNCKPVITRRSNGRIICNMPIARVNKQLRSEFLEVASTDAPEIVAKVDDFDFRHVVTFFNRLSERGHRTLLGEIQDAGERRMLIKLNVRWTSYPTGRLLDVFYPELLMRWVRRKLYVEK